MRIRVLVLGDNPVSLVADQQLLRDRGLLVFTAFNLQNINELVSEINPDIVFFDVQCQTPSITQIYNEFISCKNNDPIPVIFNYVDDDVYLITRKRTSSMEKRTIIADNIIDAVKMALRNNKTYQLKPYIHLPVSATQLPIFPARA